MGEWFKELYKSVKYYFSLYLCSWMGHKFGPYQHSVVPLGGPYVLEGKFSYCERCGARCKGRNTKAVPLYDPDDSRHPWKLKGWQYNRETKNWQHPDFPGEIRTLEDRVASGKVI